MRIKARPAVQRDPCRRRDIERLHAWINGYADLQCGGGGDGWRAAVFFAAEDDHQALGQGCNVLHEFFGVGVGDEDLQVVLFRKVDEGFGGGGDDRQTKHIATTGTDEAAVVNIHVFGVEQHHAADAERQRSPRDGTDVARDAHVLQHDHVALNLGDGIQPDGLGCFGDGKDARDLIVLEDLFGGAFCHLKNFN